MSRKTNQPSDKLMKALELHQANKVHQLGANHYRVGSGTKLDKSYGVGFKHGEHFCGCADYEIRSHICKHIVASFAPALIHLAFQVRYVARDAEDLGLICDHYRSEINALHPVFRAMAKAEKEAARERLSVEVKMAA
jgi:hypothetical protein